MKLAVFLFIIFNSFFQDKSPNNQSDGIAIDGYDVVAYFTEDKAVEGTKDYATQYYGLWYYFSSEKHLDLFKANPQKYLPEYGGWCAYAVATKSQKMGVDPETFEIRDGKLYLFYNGFFNNTLKDWKQENPKELVKKGDQNWEVLKNQAEE